MYPEPRQIPKMDLFAKMLVNVNFKLDKVLNTPLINLFKVNNKNNSVVVRLNQIMSKRLTLK